ncbi:MAG: VWA-like domain-containing protein [Candidatus Woesearchaeota archaeon]
MKNIIITIDMSASIDYQLNKFLKIVYLLSKFSKKVIIIFHDYNIVDEIEINQKVSKEYIMNLKQPYGGGTSHQYVFERIDQIYDEEDISHIVFLSDFMSDFYHLKEYNFLDEFEVTWSCWITQNILKFGYYLNGNYIQIMKRREEEK